MYTNGDSKLPSLRLSMVCYADILGFRAMIECAFESGEENEFLRKVKISLDAAYKEVNRDATTGDSGIPILDMQILDRKFFTDNIVVGYPLHNPVEELGEGELGSLLVLFALAQARLAVDGFLLRGAITAGQHYQDDEIVYGDALLEAVDLDKSGGPPRLVIGPSVEPLIWAQLATYGDSWDAPHHEHLLEDPSDRSLFVNYLSVAFENFADEFTIDYQLLAAHRRVVCKGLRDYAPETSVGQKYAWLATYHNYVCHTFAEPLMAGDEEGTDNEELDLQAVAESVLSHVVPLKSPPAVQPPRPLDADRLELRLTAI